MEISSNHFRISQATFIFGQQFRRSLEQNETIWDDDHRDGKENLIALSFGAVFFFAFFAFWNTLISGRVLVAFRDIGNGECTESAFFLLCPHWIVGILLPCLVGYSSMGIGGLIFFASITVILPYGFNIWLHRREATAPESDVENTDVEVGDNPSLLSGPDRKAYLERTLKFSKVVEGSILDTTNVGVSFRANHPKSDILVPKGEGEEDDASSSRRGIACTICLEAYENNDAICWSRNPACHHAFHKECVMDWLMQKTECPVCRRPYIGVGIDGDDHHPFPRVPDV